MNEVETNVPVPATPFRGIEPLRYVDQLIFTARTSEIWSLESSITRHRAALLYGDSGTGKSSLINAGLIPRLRAENYAPDRLRVQPRLGREIKVERISTHVEGKPPFLPSTLARNETAANFEISIAEFMRRIRGLKDSSGEMVESDPTQEAQHPLLIFDQFEEFVTLFEEAMRGGDTQEAREAAAAQEKIMSALVELIRDSNLPVKILFVFREDYLAKLNILFEHCPNLLDQYLRLCSPRVEDLQQIIRAPFRNEELRAQFVGTQANGGGSELTDELAGLVADELKKRSEGGRVNLSELQIVCRKLWESADPETLFKEKGVQGLLEQYLSAVVEDFPADLREPAAALLGQMITSCGTRNIVSQDNLINIEKDNFSQERIKQTLDALTSSKLVTLEIRRDVYFYEIVSEFLVPWIKEQEAARVAFIERRKLKEEAEKKAAQVRIEAETKAAADRLAAMHQLELAQQQKRTVKYVSAAIVIGALIVCFVIVRQRGKAKEAELRAQDAFKISDVLSDIANGTSEDKLQALDELDTLIKQGKVSTKVGAAIFNIALADSDQQVVNKTVEVYQTASQTNRELSQTVSVTDHVDPRVTQKLNLPPRFYIQIASKEQDERAKKIKDVLTQKGYVVPPFEIVGDRRASKTNELRYYNLSETGDAKPDNLVALLRSVDGNRWSAKYIENSGKVRPGHFELWLAPDASQTSPDKSSKDGRLIVGFEDEEGNEIQNVEFRLIIKSTSDPERKPIISRGGDTTVPPGDYEMTVSVKGYKDISHKFSMKEKGEVELLKLPLRKSAERKERDVR